jgi:hypothetical protein
MNLGLAIKSCVGEIPLDDLTLAAVLLYEIDPTSSTAEGFYPYTSRPSI